MAVLTLEQINKTFNSGGGQVVANKNINLKIEEGEKVLLNGPSGSGKTTLLSIIGCLLRPTSGRIFLNDQEITHLDDKEVVDYRLKYIGFVFQSFNLLPLLSAKENVMLPARLQGVSGKEAAQKATTILEHLGLAARQNHLPADLSGGEKQRAATARALINNPTLILADEPTANLDSVSGRGVIELLCKKALAEGGKSIIIASHDQRIIPFVNRIIRMEDGQITEDRQQPETSQPKKTPAPPLAPAISPR